MSSTKEAFIFYFLLWNFADDTRCITACGDIGAAFKIRQGNLYEHTVQQPRLGRRGKSVTIHRYDNNEARSNIPVSRSNAYDGLGITVEC